MTSYDGSKNRTLGPSYLPQIDCSVTILDGKAPVQLAPAGVAIHASHSLTMKSHAFDVVPKNCSTIW